MTEDQISPARKRKGPKCMKIYDNNNDNNNYDKWTK
jgi:hypothetical protein